MSEPLPTRAPRPSDDAPRPDEEAASSLSPFHAAWPLLLSLSVLGLIGYYTFEPDTFGQLIDHLRPWHLVAAVATVAARVYFGGWRLRYVARGRITMRSALRGQLAWDFFSNITPSAIGGAPVATVYMARDTGRTVGEATAIMLFSMLLDQLWFAITIPILLAASLVIDVFPQTLGNVGVTVVLLYFVGMLAWVLAFAYTMLIRPDFLERLVIWLFSLRWLRRFQDRATHEARQLRKRAHVLRAQPPRFYLMGLVLTAGTWITRYLTLVFIVWSVYASADGLLLTARTAAMLLGSLVMPTPGGSGGIEGLYAFFIAPLIPSAVVAPTLLVWRLLAYYIFIALGVYLTMHQVRRRRDPDMTVPAASDADVADNG